MSHSVYDDIPVPPFVVPFGYSNDLTIYVYDSTSSTWKEIQNVSFRATKNLNQISEFNISFIDISTEERTYIKEFATVMIFVENTLFLKGRIQKVNYISDFECEVQGYGMEAKLLEKDFIKDNDKRVQYDNTSAKTIANEILSTNSDGVTPWVMNPASTGLFETDYGDVSIRYEYTSRMKALIGLCEAIDYEWWISQSDNPYTTDYFNIAPIKGNQTPLFTYDISGENANCEQTSYERDINNMANRVDILGYGDGINQVKTDFYDASDVYSVISANVETTGTVTVLDTTGFPSTGIIKIGREYIPYTSISGSGFNCTRDYGSKEHKIGVLTYEWYDGSTSNTTLMNGTIVSSSGTIIVDDCSSFSSSGTIIIGSELVSYGSKIGSTAFNSCTRGILNTTATNHSDNVRVFEYNSTKHYTSGGAEIEGTDAKTGSSVKTNGLVDYPIPDVTLRDEPTAELIASGNLLVYKEAVLRYKILPDDFITDIQQISLGDKLILNDPNGGINNIEERVIGVTIGINEDFQPYSELSLSNDALEFVEQMSSIADRSVNQSKYMKGQTVLLPIGPVQENCDASNPMNMRFLLPDDVVAINKVELNFSVADYRAATTMNASAGTNTSGNNSVGSIVVSNTNGGLSSIGMTYAGSIPASYSYALGTYCDQDASEIEFTVMLTVNMADTTPNSAFQIFGAISDGTSNFPDNDGDCITSLLYDTSTTDTSEAGGHSHAPYSAERFLCGDSGAFFTTTVTDTVYGHYHGISSGDRFVGKYDGYDISEEQYTDVNADHVHTLDYGVIAGLALANNYSLIKTTIRVPHNPKNKSYWLYLWHNQSGKTVTTAGIINITVFSQHTHNIPAHTHGEEYAINTDGGGSGDTITLKVGNNSNETQVGTYSGTNNTIDVKDYLPSSSGIKNIQFIPSIPCRIEAIGYIKCFIESN